MNSRTLAKLTPLAALLGLPTDTSKQYAYRPGGPGARGLA